MVSKIGTFIALALVLLSSACLTLPREQIPPAPPPIRPTTHATYMEQVRHAPAAETDICVSVAGARLAENGMYVDLLVTDREEASSVDDDERQRDPRILAYAGHLGSRISRACETSTYLELVDAGGKSVALRPMQLPHDFHVTLPLTVGLFHHPNPPQMDMGLTADGRHAVIQTCLLRTKRPLQPGEFRMRLVPPAERADDQTFVSDWVTVRVDRAAEHPGR